MVNLAQQIESGQPAITGIMMESHLVEGQQSIDAVPLKYGQSITDACLGIDDAFQALDTLAGAIRRAG